MKNLKDILYRVPVEAVFGSTDLLIKNIAFDSRKVEQDDLFVALKGTVSDGHVYISDVIAKGAKVIICQEIPEYKESNVTYVQVDNSNEALAILAANFYENPSSKLKLVGVTGTNGKTTIASLLYDLFKKAGYKVG